MIKKYVYGNPFKTESVIIDVDKADESLPYFTLDENGGFVYKLNESDVVYGH